MRNAIHFALLGVIAVAFFSSQATGQVSQASELDLKAGDLRSNDLQASFAAGNTLTCTQPSTIIRVPSSLAQRAKLKVRLVTLLRESLYDDARGVVNIAREKEIKKLANKLRSGAE